MIFVGIDPGVHGGVVSIDEHGIRSLADTPSIKVTSGKKNRNEYQPAQMASLLRQIRDDSSKEAHVIIERVSAFPGEGVVSSFNFGKGFGMWLGILSALNMPYTLVMPRQWKKVMLEGSGHDKGMSRLRAQQVFPLHVAEFSRVKDDGRAEAALMALYGMRQHGKKLEGETEIF